MHKIKALIVEDRATVCQLEIRENFHDNTSGILKGHVQKT